MKKGFIFKSARFAVVLIVSCSIAVFLFALRSKPEKRIIETPVPVVEVTDAFFETIVMQVEVFGTVKASQIQTLSAEVPGRFFQIHPDFAEGNCVQEGDVLLQIDPRSYQLEMEAAQVSVRQAELEIDRLAQEILNLQSDQGLAEANAKLSANELKRLKALSAEEYASRNSLDKAEQSDIEARIRLKTIKNQLLVASLAMKQKKQALEMAKIRADMAKLSLDKACVKAEFTGYVSWKTVEAGEFVSVGKPLGALYLKGALDVDVQVPVEKMQWLAPAIEAGLMPPADVRLTGRHLNGVWKAKLARTKAQVDEKTRTLPMILEIDKLDEGFDAAGKLLPGTFVACTIFGTTHEGICILPRHLVKPGKIVMTVKEDRLLLKKVTVLREFQEQIYIEGGLEPGDKIVTSPLTGAISGMKVVQKTAEVKTDS